MPLDRAKRTCGFRGLGLGALAATLVVSGCFWDASGHAPPTPDAYVPPDVVDSACGDGVRGPGEDCDGADLGGQTCVGLGHPGGDLSCSPECYFDTSGCDPKDTCGNGQLDADEACDTALPMDDTCLDWGSRTDGEVRCTPQCTIDISDCHTCGDGVVEGPERCDVELQGRDCLGQGFDGGELRCTDCDLDTSGCFTCGDGRCDVTKGESRAVCPQDCGWMKVSAGRQHTCAVSGEGEVLCWGRNDDGQLGTGDQVNRFGPTPVLALAGGVAVSAGRAHSCALLGDGAVWCWGDNEHGQLGDGTTSASVVPRQVAGLVGVDAISAGASHTCARSGQALYCWGRNHRGQLGDGTTMDRHLPVPVVSYSGLTSVVLVTAGSEHTCGVDTGGAAWCWGGNDRGQLGDGTLSGRVEPTPVSTLSGLVQVSHLVAALSHTCGVSPMGAVWCWGQNSDGRLGDGTHTDRLVPQAALSVTGLHVAMDVAAGTAHSCAVDVDGAVWCWGDNGQGRLGDGSDAPQDLPVLVSRATGMASGLEVTGGEAHTCSLGIDTSLWCWGANGAGQLGDGTVTDRQLPVEVPAL